jgi:hypothetical protein
MKPTFFENENWIMNSWCVISLDLVMTFLLPRVYVQIVVQDFNVK